MDKKIIDTLIKFGLITNIDVDSEKYKDVDDLINKGIITIPGAKTKILELIGDVKFEEVVDNTINVEVVEPTIVEDLKTDEQVITDTPEDVVPIDETPETAEVIDETPVEEVPVEVPSEEATVTEEVTETIVEEVTEETVEEPVKKAKKTTKKSE